MGTRMTLALTQRRARRARAGSKSYHLSRAEARLKDMPGPRQFLDFDLSL